MEGKQIKQPKITTIINRTKVNEYTAGYHLSKDTYPVIEEKVKEILKQAMLRASGGRRTTILPRDI